MTVGPRPALALALPAIAGALLALTQAASAQEAPPAQNLERAQKAADAVFHWIKLNADKGANRQQPAPAPAPAPAQAAKKPAAAPVAAAPKPAAPVTNTAANSAANPAAGTASPTPAPAPVTTAAAPAPEPDRAPVVVAVAEPSPPPAAPLAVAAKAAEPPAPAQEEAEEPLRLMAKVEPVIPRQLAQTAFRNGFAQVQFVVAPDGSVQQASVIKASHNRLGAAAVEAVKQWKFAPIRKAREAAVEVAFNNEAE
ncbi:TonB family protein [Roseateles sp. BYS87W]|uniref:TonB family protein n=1 Tax=Pelomonas baiyunensis TaxID=3299026 RepID=A0ABW7GSX6_9BURK